MRDSVDTRARLSKRRFLTLETTIYIGGLIEKVTLGAVSSWKHYNPWDRLAR